MGTKTNPGAFDCYANAEPDEPMFVLLARDPLAPARVREWVTEHRMRRIDEWIDEWIDGGDGYPYGLTDQEAEALDCANAMESWRAANR